ncbi:MAG TPA: Hsp20/alpha crystallin family protein [Candidatus Angelobacter sp.]|nr:Hsp20/alpha crystallin family protein [Candidatus Angelobacter sp.]
MAYLTRFEPFRDLVNFQNQINRIFQDYSRGNDELLTSGTFVPPVDIYENEHNIILKLEVPGIEEKDLDIKLENNTLTVRGERNFEKEEKEENFHRIERRYGAFARSFTLPNTVDPENVNASYENGILKLQLAKKAEAKPKQIKVGTSTAPKTIEAKKSQAA